MRLILVGSVLRRDTAPWARRESVLARPSHWRWMWNTSPWHGVSPQGRPLPGTQALSRIGDRIIGPQPLHGGVEQMHAPGVGVTVLLRRQQVAVGRHRIDPGQHGRGALENIIVQADANA